MLITTPCFAQGLGNMPTFGGMSSPPGSFGNYGNSTTNYGNFNQNYGNNPNVFEHYRPQVSDYLKQDPRAFNPYQKLMQSERGNFPVRSYNKFNQFDPTIPPN
jgi:hypothetical protein